MSPVLMGISVVMALGAVLGCSYSVALIRRRRRALASARSDDPVDVVLVDIARTALTTEYNRLGTQSMLLLVSLVSVFFPEPQDWIRVIVRSALVAAIVLIYLNSYFVYRAEERQWAMSRERNGAQ